MANFPSVITTFNIVNATDRLNSPSHSALHNSVSLVVTQIQTVIGTDSSVLGTILGDLRNANSAGGGHVQTAVKGGTGQTTFTKGDLLVATSPSVLSKLAIGANQTILTADSTSAAGLKWGTQGIVQTFVTKSPLGTGNSVIATMNSSILGYTGMFNLPISINANKISIDVGSVLVQGSFKVGIYSEDGQTQYSSILVASVTTNGVKSINISSVAYASGNYYSVVVPVDGNFGIRAWTTGDAPSAGFSSIAGKSYLSGSQTVTGGILPTTFVPSILSASSNNTVVFRLDN